MGTKGEKTREYILDASYALFAKKGFKQVTMKDVCEISNMSRGGLYSHFSGTSQIFEALLEKITEKDAMDFQSKIEERIPATNILEEALILMEDEMKHPEESLSIAMYEYAEMIDSNVMERFNNIGEEKWSNLIRYGIENGEFQEVDVKEIVNVILFSYQGIRMWSRIISMKQETFRSIVKHIKKQLIGEQK